MVATQSTRLCSHTHTHQPVPTSSGHYHSVGGQAASEKCAHSQCSDIQMGPLPNAELKNAQMLTLPSEQDKSSQLALSLAFND